MAMGDLGLREGRARVIMRCMKSIRVTGCAIFALISLSACYQQQQQQPGAIPTPEAVATESPIAEGEQDTATAQQEQEGENIDANEESSTATENEPERKHVCSGLLSCKLGLCPNGKKRNGELAGQDSESTNQTTETTENITPSAEQMEAALALIAAENKKQSSGNKTAPAQHTATESATATAAPVIVQNNTSGIPGRGGLRMGHFAPREEATSTADANAPLPNAAERHGLRSPSLPKSLPMNIDGKTNAH